MADYEEFDGDGEEYEREAPEVYRRRRIIAAIIAILAIILVVWALVFAFQRLTGSGDDTAAASSATAGDNFDSFSARPTGSASGAASGSASAQPSESASAEASPTGQPSADAEGTEASASPTDQAAAPTPEPTTQQPVQACSDALTVSTTVDQQAYAAGQQPVITTTVANGSQNPCTVDLGSANITYQITSGPAHVYSSQTCQAQPTHDEATLQAGAKQTTSLTWDRGMNAYGCGQAAQQAKTGYYWVTATVNGVSSRPTLIVIQ
ncbi:hypothetical protein [Rothia kristinae]|uniref:Uncharacterized protein n=1 Tax=Rothia kristinae TaxID=37923 RepID=A0A1S2MZR4_9MICC|nr:hypothetical protein [Rothia kristinae]OIJ35870.1 hypothetical protein BK826_05820 [Rothia kristinae]